MTIQSHYKIRRAVLIQKIHSQNDNAMKKILAILFAVLLLFGCGNQKYQKNIDDAIECMEKITGGSAAISSTYIDTWRTAIYDHEYNGEYCSDFNEALAKHKVFILSSDAFKELTIKMAKTDSLINELRDYPSSYKEAFDEIVSIYTDVDAMYESAKDPEGSLSSYSDKVMSSYENTSKRIKAFKIKYCSDKK